jgi:hypothetical protein
MKIDGDRHLVADGAWPHVDERIAASGAVVDHHKFGAALFGVEHLDAKFTVAALNQRRLARECAAGHALQPLMLARLTLADGSTV